jgi:hypothetical protein
VTRVGEIISREQLERCGWCDLLNMRDAMDNRDVESRAEARQKAREMYWLLNAIAREAVA